MQITRRRAGAAETLDRRDAAVLDTRDRRMDRASRRARAHAPWMFVVTEENEAAIRAVYEQRGEFAAVVALRQRFPDVTDNAQAQACARTIAGWKPLPLLPVKRMHRGAAVRSGPLMFGLRLPALAQSWQRGSASSHRH